jgi:hypothetical protein
MTSRHQGEDEQCNGAADGGDGVQVKPQC